MDQKQVIFQALARAGQRLKLLAAGRSVMRQINGYPLFSLNRRDRTGVGPALPFFAEREREREREVTG